MPSAEYLAALAREEVSRRARIAADLRARKARVEAAQASVRDANEKASQDTPAAVS